MTLFPKDQLLVPVFMKRGKEEDVFQNVGVSHALYTKACMFGGMLVGV